MKLKIITKYINTNFEIKNRYFFIFFICEFFILLNILFFLFNYSLKYALNYKINCMQGQPRHFHGSYEDNFVINQVGKNTSNAVFWFPWGRAKILKYISYCIPVYIS